MKVNDKVRIIGSHLCNMMNEYINNEEFTITRIDKDIITVTNKTGNITVNGTADMFELIDNKTEDMIIFTVKLTSDNNVYCECGDYRTEPRYLDMNYMDDIIHSAVDEFLADDEDEEEECMNGKYVCIESNSDNMTVGKIYTFKDGEAVLDDGIKSPGYKNLDEFHRLNGFFIKLIEIKE